MGVERVWVRESMGYREYGLEKVWVREGMGLEKALS